MRTLFIIILGCFCLCLAAPVVQAAQGPGSIDVSVHVTVARSHSLSEAELVELEDLEDQSGYDVVAFMFVLSADVAVSTPIPALADRYEAIVSDIPRYIRVRQLII
jgi:predicted neuraminidase